MGKYVAVYQVLVHSRFTVEKPALYPFGPHYQLFGAYEVTTDHSDGNKGLAVVGASFSNVFSNAFQPTN